MFLGVKDDKKIDPKLLDTSESEHLGLLQILAV